jgi:peptidylprolyl isomerase
VASSRQRERELARRRYERRRQRAQELRARRRRRNTIAGAAIATLAVLGGLIALIVSLASGGSGTKVATAASLTPTPSPTPTPVPPAPTRCATIKPDPPRKGQPLIPQVTGRAPTRLVVKDVKKGTGAVARKGSSLSVTYIGVACSTGAVFDASYLHGGTPFTVSPIGSAAVIAGWNQGLIGVRAGGIRELVIPASLGYGTAGAGTIKPNKTLIFLVTVKSVK